MRALIYRFLWMSGFALLLLSLFGGQHGANEVFAQQAATEQPPRSVSVSGIGQANVKPDVAVIVVGVQTEAQAANTALTQNSQQMQAMLTTLTNTGILTDDIQTQVVQLQPQTPESTSGQPQPVPQATQPQTNTLTSTVTSTVAPIGYIATNLVEVRVRDLAKLGQVLDATVQAGGNRIQSIRFESSNPEQALDQARQAAWKDAQHKAQQLAQLADAKLGPVLTLNEFSTTSVPAPQAAMAATMAAVPIASGAQTVSVNVQVTWSLTE